MIYDCLIFTDDPTRFVPDKYKDIPIEVELNHSGELATIEIPTVIEDFAITLKHGLMERKVNVITQDHSCLGLNGQYFKIRSTSVKPHDRISFDGIKLYVVRKVTEAN